MEENVEGSKSIEISIIVPAYNEEKRLPLMLPETIEFFRNQKINFEIIVVNDGSKDKTTDVALSYSEVKGSKVNIKVIEYERNKGKGGAVRIGMLSAKGKYILMADADGATDINDFTKVMKTMKNIEHDGLGIVAGSRHHLIETDAVVKRKFIRNVLMWGFNFVVKYIVGVKLDDTQCGFKLFTSKTATLIFLAMHLERWAFDVEAFVIANALNIKCAEVPVNWEEIDGSKLNVLEASISMARDFLMVRILYLLRVWGVADRYRMPQKFKEKNV